MKCEEGASKLPKRKHTRLKEYDYSQGGYYHITVCTQDNKPILSNIVGRENGGGKPPPYTPAEVALTKDGKIAEEQLLDIPNRYPSVSVDKYVIMPTHIHAIIIIDNDMTEITAGECRAGACPRRSRPTLMDAVRVFKSISTRLCNQSDNVQGRKIWQTSFYDEVIRNEQAYHQIWKYIDENPIKWYEDKYFNQCT